MGRQGIEWAVYVYEFMMLLVPVSCFIALRRRIKQKVITKTRAFLYYLGLVISPVAVYIIFFLGLVGLEEVAKTAIITEGMAKSFLILILLGLVVWLTSSIIFGVALMFIRGTASSSNLTEEPDGKKFISNSL